MALQDMMKYIQEDVQKEVEDRKNKVKVEITKMLISYSEMSEKKQENQLYEFSVQLKKQEDMLKAEQNFLELTKELSSENLFSEEFLLEIKEQLLQYSEDHRFLYEEVLFSWMSKSHKALGSGLLSIQSSEKDIFYIQEITKKLSMDVQITENHSIKAGFIISTDNGVSIDLTFETMFDEKKQHLLNIVMPILKENL